jgi:hypothetical protein
MMISSKSVRPSHNRICTMKLKADFSWSQPSSQLSRQGNGDEPHEWRENENGICITPTIGAGTACGPTGEPAPQDLRKWRMVAGSQGEEGKRGVCVRKE